MTRSKTSAAAHPGRDWSDADEDLFQRLRKAQLIEETVMRNGSLQGAYFIIAARALGLPPGTALALFAVGRSVVTPDAVAKIVDAA